MYTLGFFGCTHLGYGMKGMNRRHPSGQNLRVVDGFTAHELIIKDMLAAGVNGLVDGGDLFHVEHPPVRAVNAALRVDDLRVDAAADTASPIWRITNGGNHDNGASTNLSAVSHIHRPHLHSRSVFPDPGRQPEDQVGPWPGFYEVHQPDPDLALYIHVVSHNGLDAGLADRGIVIDPQPVDGGVNLLVSHGIFSADGRLFGADDAHGAHRVIPEDWANRGWDQVLLSDYHTLSPIPGFGPEDGRDQGQVWMTGSALRRGFSDEPCGRGWLEVTLDDTGRVTVTPRTIWQRPQVDFPAIDAREHTTEQIDELIRQRLSAQQMWDEESEKLTGDGGFILRQTITHTTPQQRRALAVSRAAWAGAARDAAYWSADYTHPLTASSADGYEPDVVPDPATRRSLLQEFEERKNYGKMGAVLRDIASDSASRRDAVIDRVKDTLASVHIT